MLRGFRDFVMRGNVARFGTGADAETPTPSDEAKLLTEIRDLLAERPPG